MTSLPCGLVVAQSPSAILSVLPFRQDSIETWILTWATAAMSARIVMAIEAPAHCSAGVNCKAVARSPAGGFVLVLYKDTNVRSRDAFTVELAYT